MGDTAKVLTIRLRVQDDGSVVLERGAKAIDHLGAGARGAARDLKQTGDGIDDVSRRLKSATSMAQAFFGAWAVQRVGRAMGGLIEDGVEFNAQLQTSKLGIASLVSGLGEIKGAHGEILQGQARWNAALQISGQLQKQAQIAALQTKAEYKDIIRLLQEGMGPMLGAGITDPSKIIKLVQGVAQTGGALGVPGDRLGQEIRSLLRGEKGPDNQIANALLGDVSKQKLDQLREAGKLYDFLMEKMSSFQRAGEETADTFEGALSNLKDAFHQALGEATQGTTSDLTRLLKELTGEIVQFDAKGHAAFNQEFVGGVRDIGSAFLFVAGGVVTAIKSIDDMVDRWRASKEMLSDWRAWQPFGDVGSEGDYQQRLNRQHEERARIEKNRRNSADPDRRMKEEMEMYGQVISPDLKPLVGQGSQLGSKPKAPADANASQLRAFEKLKADYLRLHADFRAEAEAAGDPLKIALTKIESERRAKLDALSAQKKEYAKLFGSKFFDEEKARLNAQFDEQSANTAFGFAVKGGGTYQNAAQKALGVDLKAMTEDHQRGKEIALKTSREIADERLAIAKESASSRKEIIELELREKLLAHQRELDDLREKLGPNGEATAEYKAAVAAKEAKDKEAEALADKLRKEDTVGTKEWADKVHQIVQQQVGDLPRLMTDAAISSRLAVTGEIEGFLNDVVNGQADAMKSLEGLAHSLGSVWAHELSGILSNGKSVTTQFKEMWSDLNGKTGADAALSGAGMGSMVGGMFQTSSNRAGMGGAAGGAIGAVLGSVIPGIGTALGSVLGSVLGSALGSLVKKGEDFINVAIHGVTAGNIGGVGTTINNDSSNKHQSTRIDLGDGSSIEVDEKGISADARHDLAIQVKRRIRDEMKAWQHVLDLLPQTLQDELANMKIPTTLNLNGGVKEADIKDESALSSLQDFLGKKLPQATFDAYKGSIQAALGLLGANKGQIEKLAQYWGTLQGSELHDAVLKYFQVVVDTNELKGKLGMDDMNKTPLGHLQDLTGQIALARASQAKLTDVDDIIAAQEHINDLSRQYYTESQAAMQQLIGLSKQLHGQNRSLYEQIDLAGKTDQEKINYFYDEMTKLRAQMLVTTDDPQQFAALEQKMNAYVQAAFGLAPDSTENRDKLKGILDDVEKVREQQFGKAQADLATENQKAATMLQDAAKKLLEAADAISGKTPPDDTTGTGKDDDTTPGKTGPEKPVISPVRLAEVSDDLRHLFDWKEDASNLLTQLKDADNVNGVERDRRLGEQIGAAIERAITNAKFSVTLPIQNVTNVDTTRQQVINESIHEVQVQMKRQPDNFRPPGGWK